MRKANREVNDPAEILRIMRQCDVCRLALNDGGFPYIVPLNFGLVERKSAKSSEGGIDLVFHSALEGRKLELMAKDARASFEMDCNHVLQYFPEKGYCTMSYESVIGRGTIEMIEDENEKIAALDALMAQFHPEDDAPYSPTAIPRTAVYRLKVESMVGKRKAPK